MTRRGVMKGVGGLAAVSMSGATLAEAQDVMAGEVPTDPHTRDTYRAIVDAIVPRTPELGDELGDEHIAGGLDVELEKFLIWDFNHFQEIRLETLQTPIDTAMVGEGPLGSLTDGELDGLTDGLDGGAGSLDGVTELVDGLMAPELFRLELDTLTAGSELDALADLAGVDAAAELDDVLGIDDGDRFGELLDFGTTDSLAVDFADAPIPEDAAGVAAFDLLVETGTETTHRVLQNYPYAAVFPLAFDAVAAEFLTRGDNQDPPSPNPQFPGGGTFTRLSREDRLRCLWTIVDGGVLDRLDGVLSAILPTVGILKYVVMACNGLHGFGYYTEWSGYGDTKANTPSERELAGDAGDVQSRTQTGYPGPADGYAADWRHLVDDGFTDEWDAPDEPAIGDAPGSSDDDSTDTADTTDTTADSTDDAVGDLTDLLGGGLL